MGIGLDVVIVLLLALLIGGYTLRLREMRRVAEHHLGRALQSEQVFAHTFYESPVPLALLDLASYRITDVNLAFERLVGEERDALLGASFLDHGFEDATLLATVARRVRRDGRIRDYHADLATEDGGVRHVQFSMDLFVVDGKAHVLTTFVDQTEHRRAVEALQSADQRLRELAENIDEVFFVSLPDRSRVLYVSPAYEKVWGRSSDELYVSPLGWLDAVHPDDRARAATTAPLREFRVVRPDGSLRWLRVRAFPIHDEGGTVVRIAGVAQDITEQRALEEQLRHAQKMESLGMLAGGVAHDFNNLLAVISSCSGLLADAIERDDPSRELVEDIADAVVRATALTRQLLAFSRKQVIEPQLLDANVVVTDTRKMLRRVVGETIDVVTSLEPDLRPTLIDRGHLVQVILNLALNARDAMPSGGTLTLTTRNDGDNVVLEITDSGTGMSDDVLARACEPFFTTKEPGKGTGMGLAVVHGIIDQAGGRITITSKLGAGTTFRITLPAFDGQPENLRAVNEQTTRGVERILIVDDDEYVLRATARALRSRGYRVVEAGNGRAALTALMSASFDLLLTDMVMPGMSGRVLAEAASARFPELRVLFMTGYTDDEIVRDGVATGVVELIEKPFTLQALAAKVRGVLDAHPTPLSPPPTACREIAPFTPAELGRGIQ